MPDTPPQPQPYVPEEGWAFYRLGDVPTNWTTVTALGAVSMTAGERRLTQMSDVLVLARPPEPELIAVMLPADFVDDYANHGAVGGSDIVRAACRAALAASPVSET